MQSARISDRGREVRPMTGVAAVHGDGRCFNRRYEFFGLEECPPREEVGSMVHAASERPRHGTDTHPWRRIQLVCLPPRDPPRVPASLVRGGCQNRHRGVGVAPTSL